MVNKPAWNTTCKRFVAFLDIMGFKDKVFRESHEKVKSMLESLRPTIALIENSTKAGLIQRIIKSPGKDDIVSTPSAVFPVTFSDSIILISGDDSDISAPFIFTYVELILINAINNGIPMKGAIACGELTADPDKSLYFGRPIIDAYELQNELQLYGVVLHHTCEKRLNELKIIKYLEDKDIFKYYVPMKSSKITHFIVNWISQSMTEKDILDLGTKLYSNVSGTPRLYVDNTMEFVRWITARKLELEQKKKSPSRPVTRRKKA